MVAVEDRARKDRLAALAGNQQHIRDVPLLLVFLADSARHAQVAAGRATPSEGLDYLDTFLMFRTEYEGRTLREHYGLARAENRNERAALRGAAE